MSNDFNFAFEQNIDSARGVKKEMKAINPDDYIVRAKDEFQDTLPILSHKDVPLFNSGEISLITGEPKTKKTFLVSYFIAELLAKREHSEFISNLQHNILLIDTEQGRKRTNSVIRRIYRLLNKDFSHSIENFTAISIRELSASERFLVLEKAITEKQYSIVFLDGFADLLLNTNDISECALRVSEIMSLSEAHSTHICCVVHTNPHSDKTRGHIGSELQRKCETVMIVKKDGDVSVVSPQYCRNKEFERFSFLVNPNGLPETCDVPNDVQARLLFSSIFEGFTKSTYSDLRQQVMEKENVSRATAERRVQSALEKNVLKKNDDGSYSLS
jgi:hypothetical protein